MTPIRSVMLGCLRMLCITISFWISESSSSVSLGSKIFLIATGVPFRYPLWMTEKPPWPICSDISISYRVISLTPGTLGNLAALVDSSEVVCVNEPKLALCISCCKSSICFWSRLEFFCSFCKSYSSLFESFWFPLAVVGRILAVVGRSFPPR